MSHHQKQVDYSSQQYQYPPPASAPTPQQISMGPTGCSECGGRNGHTNACSVMACSECGGRAGGHTQHCSRSPPVMQQSQSQPTIVIQNSAAASASASSSSSSRSRGRCCGLPYIAWICCPFTMGLSLCCCK